MRFKSIKILPSILSDHSGIKIEVNTRKISHYHTITWKLNNLLPNNFWEHNEIKADIRKFFEMSKNRATAQHHGSCL